MPDSTPNSRELALCEINTGTRYTKRCEIARMKPADAAVNMVCIAAIAAREHGEMPDGPVTAADLLLCAVKLLEYYQRHNAESEALAAHDARQDALRREREGR